MTDIADFRKRRQKKDLRASKEAAITGLRQAAEILLKAIPEVEAGTVTWEVDDLMLEVADALVPLEQFFADELRPEHIE